MAFIERLFWTVVWIGVGLVILVWLLHLASNLPGGLGNFFNAWGKAIEY